MKYLFVILLLVTACGGSSVTEPTPKPKDTKPSLIDCTKPENIAAGLCYR